MALWEFVASSSNNRIKTNI